MAEHSVERLIEPAVNGPGLQPAGRGVSLERRKVMRHRTLKSGSIAFNSAARIDCRVRNLSPAGACLDVTSPIGIPDDFVLLIDSDHAKHDCRVIWRAPSRLGVAFRR